MKKKYKIMLALIILECVCFSLMNKFDIHIQSWIGTVLGISIFFAPVSVLLYLLGKDNDVSIKYRLLAKFLLSFIVICCLAGVIVKTLGLNN